MVNGEAVAGTGTSGTSLHLYPDDSAAAQRDCGTQTQLMHSESGCPASFEASGYQPRSPSDLFLLKRRLSDGEGAFALETIIDCASDKVGDYRPKHFREHNDFKQFYLITRCGRAPPGRSEEPAPPTQLPRRRKCFSFADCSEARGVPSVSGRRSWPTNAMISRQGALRRKPMRQPVEICDQRPAHPIGRMACAAFAPT